MTSNNSNGMTVKDLPMKEIYEDTELNCRGEIIPMDVIELAKSIDENGLLEPIAVEPYSILIDGRQYNYRIIMGYRRFTAFKLLKRDTIPCNIKTGLNELQVRVLNLQENLQRKNLNMMQEAVSIKKFYDAGYTMKEVANMLNVSSGWVQIRYSALGLPPEIQEVVAAGLLTQEQVKDVASFKTKEEQYHAVKTIKESKERGDRKALKVKKPKKDPTKKYINSRKREEIFEMTEHIIDNIGASLTTRALAWAAGEISDLEFYQDLQEEARTQGIENYQIPELTPSY